MDFKQRLTEEFESLIEKRAKLENFVHSKHLDEVTPIQRSLLIIQLDAMNTYATCLDERLKNL